MFRHGEAAQVAHHHQDVFIHRVDMEQVVLHLPDDAPEGGEIAAEDAVLVHAPQRVEDSLRLAQDFHEARAVERVAAECRIDLVLRAPQRAQRRCAEIGQLAMLLHQQEQFEDRSGVCSNNCSSRISSSVPLTMNRVVQRMHCAGVSRNR